MTLKPCENKPDDHSQVLGEPNIRLVLLGLEGVGKSALLVRLMSKRYIGEYNPDLETLARYSTRLYSQEICMDILDTSNRNRTEDLQVIAEWADLICLVYAVDDHGSFDEVRRLGDAVRRLSGGARLPTFCVAGNKLDREPCRQVSKDAGRRFAAHLNATFAELSAADSFHSVQAFFNEALVHTTRQKFKRGIVHSVLDRVSNPLTKAKPHASKMGAIQRILEEESDSRTRRCSCEF